jgi:hypothetical protein
MNTTTQNTENTPSLDDWYTVENLARAFPQVLATSNALRWYLRHRDTNGLEEVGAVRRCGRKFLISKTRFERWLASKATT